MTSFKYLQHVTIGKVKTNQPIKLVDYDSTWPQKFAQEEKIIKQALGKTALKIEHVGSTSITGLAAKPIIDILLIISDPADEAAYLPQLEQVGLFLRIREPEQEEHRMLIDQDEQFHVHVYGPDSKEAHDLLAFRDWLRSNPADRLKYQQTKQELAQKTWTTVQEYADAKGPVIAEIKRHIDQNS
ncbi:GrpB family protein [Lactobacillus sp. ESL0731]|uniref:GrpB family protein n=1 Tax=unclassified Lactobacillus TaxID=2620435 RepID=UPI0023F7FF3A|nr:MULTISPECIES: GrpB family protein [unclassified Lactobacillus]WEV51854.1 GrpB family protein [Lactobacillus sp. ESL0700]WEV62984.1 GrpB family protein [Lactobacillus sp. ESL0731]